MPRNVRLGQHFLTGTWAARKLAEAINPGPDETILEIGPGKGALTRELLKISSRVIAMEKDPVLVLYLTKTFEKELASGQLELVEGDIRDFDPGSLKLEAGSYAVAANIPYYITGEIVRLFLTAKNQPRAIALLIQKEVAERIVARNQKESILSVAVKAYGNPRVVAKVSRGNFAPVPNVDSAILLIEHISRNLFKKFDEEKFFQIVRAGFSAKRKFLTGNLTRITDRQKVRGALISCGIAENARAENLSLEQWKCLGGQLAANSEQ